MNDLARVLIVMGVAMTLIGLLILLALRYLPWLGNLPGDFSYEGQNYRFYFPLATILLVSIVATIILNIIIRIFRR